MKVKVDSCVYKILGINIGTMCVYYANRDNDIESIKLNKCELLSENFIDDSAIEHVKNIIDAKEKTKYSLSDAEFSSIAMNNTMNKMGNIKVGSISNMDFFGDNHIHQKVTSSKKTDEDMVNNPKHYQIGLGKYEMKDVSYALINHNKLDGREGAVYFNVLKYIGRFNNKGVPIQDLEKAEFYLKELIELTKEKDY